MQQVDSMEDAETVHGTSHMRRGQERRSQAANILARQKLLVLKITFGGCCAQMKARQGKVLCCAVRGN